jgi:ubiquinone/menaquinone biosynthesis C-methylase UbiE
VYAGSAEEAERLEIQAKALEMIVDREVEILSLTSGMKVLDAGCGTGAVTRKLASKVHPEVVIGVDIDPLFINEASKLAQAQGITNVKFQLGNVDQLTYDNDVFDVSYCRLVLMHVQDPMKTIAELKRVTKQGGFVAASDIDDGTFLSYPLAPKFMEIWRIYGERAKARGDDRYIGRQLFSIFSQAGLRSIRIHPTPVYTTQQTPKALQMMVSTLVKLVQQDKDAMMKEGLTKTENYEEAMQEVQRLLKHPGATAIGQTFLAVGEVP